MQFKRADYFNMGKWAQPVLPGTAWCSWHETDSVRAAARGRRFHPMLILDGNFPVNVEDKIQIEGIVDELLLDERAQQEYAVLLDNVGRRYEQQHVAAADALSAPLRGFLPHLFETYREVVGFWTYVLLLGDVLNEQLLARQLVASPEEMLEHLRPVYRTTWLEEQPQEIKRFAQRIREHEPGIAPHQLTEDYVQRMPGLAAAVNDHVKRFGWFGTHHWLGKGYTLQHCLGDIRDVLSKRAAPLEQEATTAVASPLWHLVAAVTYWRTHCAEVTSKGVFAARPRLVECAGQWHLLYEDLLNLSTGEITERLAAPSFSLPDNFAERKAGYGCYLEAGSGEHITVGAELERLLEELVVVHREDSSELTGTVASKGEVVFGTVKLLIEPQDFAKFEKGDILVAPETTPDYVPVMKKAAAVVTDRGGITSHAAIVSRELGIPCIIGTQAATAVLKDGDRVQVDTGRGIVRRVP